ncbi:MAG: hypothetical protein J07HQW2_02726 [Haloquadratum walsbyi J07HQW2]|uniref:Uncharacterized protein n=1 Tax=Haloquadratum walsbyi J07HQW2 TaxID=1238425 RepID=U1PV30_9EURY|nr:MAG: hypothetical protein J07HQW2_02726 [Haloquadratum walsbyi J07HQW2]
MFNLIARSWLPIRGVGVDMYHITSSVTESRRFHLGKSQLLYL